jgi:hypothetical protein
VKDLFLTLVALVVLTTFLLWQSPGRGLQWIAYSAAPRETPKPAAVPTSPKTAFKSAHLVKAERTAAEACSVSLRPQQPEQDQYSITVTPDEYWSGRPAAGLVRMVPPPDKIALGVDSDALTDAYGEPSAWATAAESGHMVETFVYAQARGGPATVIRIVDGRVVAAYKKVVPLSPPGSVVRRVGLPN